MKVINDMCYLRYLFDVADVSIKYISVQILGLVMMVKMLCWGMAILQAYKNISKKCSQYVYKHKIFVKNNWTKSDLKYQGARSVLRDFYMYITTTNKLMRLFLF